MPTPEMPPPLNKIVVGQIEDILCKAERWPQAIADIIKRTNELLQDDLCWRVKSKKNPQMSFLLVSSARVKIVFPGFWSDGARLAILKEERMERRTITNEIWHIYPEKMKANVVDNSNNACSVKKEATSEDLEKMLSDLKDSVRVQ